MAPYSPYNQTLESSGSSLPMPSHVLLTRRSLTVPVVTIAAPPAEITNVAFAASPPHFGVGPLIRQPSGHPAHAQNDASTNQHESSSRLAFLAILAIPLVGGFVVFLLIRRRGQQKPAKRSAAPPLTLRAAAARSRSEESPRMQQLPRDRIRAMNSVVRDNEGPQSPLVDYQIFSPRPPSPLPNEWPRPAGSYFALLPVPGSSELTSPLTDSATFNTTSTSGPPTPITPSFVLSPVPVETVSGSDENETEGVRFTWDFKCKGVMNRISCTSVDTVLDMSQLNSAVAPSDDQPPSSGNMSLTPLLVVFDSTGEDAAVEEDKGPDDHLASATHTPISASSEDRDKPIRCSVETNADNFSTATEDKTMSIDSSEFEHDSTFTSTDSDGPNAPSLDIEASTPESWGRSDAQFPASLTVLDLELDLTSFSSQVIEALSDTPDFMLVQSPGVEEVSNAIEVDQQTSAKDSKKRPILSKPNHRTLAPANPSLKVNAPAFDAELSATLNAYIKADFPSARGRKRASSDVNVEVLRRSRLLGDLAEKVSIARLLGLPEEAFGKAEARTELDSASWAESVLLCSSLSMPINVELACLSSVERRIRPKED